MCRNITALRGLDPVATPEEIRAAALQFVRKVAGLQKVTPSAEDAVGDAVDAIAAATDRLIAALPPRKQPPAAVPPLRRPAVRARLGLPD